MATTKQDFKYNAQSKVWINFPFLITDIQYEVMDWAEFDAFIKYFKVNQIELIRRSTDALMRYAKDIGFFSNEEFDDLKFTLFDVSPKIDNGLFKGFIISYGVDEDENSKIPWKDVYGIWKVEFSNNEIINVVRE